MVENVNVKDTENNMCLENVYQEKHSKEELPPKVFVFYSNPFDPKLTFDGLVKELNTENQVSNMIEQCLLNFEGNQMTPELFYSIYREYLRLLRRHGIESRTRSGNPFRHPTSWKLRNLADISAVSCKDLRLEHFQRKTLETSDRDRISSNCSRAIWNENAPCQTSTFKSRAMPSESSELPNIPKTSRKMSCTKRFPGNIIIDWEDEHAEDEYLTKGDFHLSKDSSVTNVARTTSNSEPTVIMDHECPKPLETEYNNVLQCTSWASIVKSLFVPSVDVPQKTKECSKATATTVSVSTSSLTSFPTMTMPGICPRPSYDQIATWSAPNQPTMKQIEIRMSRKAKFPSRRHPRCYGTGEANSGQQILPLFTTSSRYLSARTQTKNNGTGIETYREHHHHRHPAATLHLTGTYGKRQSHHDRSYWISLSTKSDQNRIPPLLGTTIEHLDNNLLNYNEETCRYDDQWQIVHNRKRQFQRNRRLIRVDTGSKEGTGLDHQSGSNRSPLPLRVLAKKANNVRRSEHHHHV